MQTSEKTCLSCEHCVARHKKENVNTDGRYVCLVLGALIPVYYEDRDMCAGMHYDAKKLF